MVMLSLARNSESRKPFMSGQPQELEGLKRQYCRDSVQNDVGLAKGVVFCLAKIQEEKMYFFRSQSNQVLAEKS